MASKRDRLARVSTRLGLTALLERLPSKRCLIALNYHRIGDPSGSPYDPEVFSATEEDFDWQIGHLRKRFPLVGPDEAAEILTSQRPLAGTCVWLTFDDGYRDNYRLAYPILRSHGATATFYLIAESVGGSTPPWWDRIAATVRRGRSRFRLTWPEEFEFDLDRDGVESSIQRAILLFKSGGSTEAERFFTVLEEACRPEHPAEGERIYLDWDEAREMLAGGMSMGSHTATHPILGKLSYEAQLAELQGSKQTLEARLGAEITTVAYPLGARWAFNDDTRRAAREAGYQLGLSFYGGFNIPGASDPFNVERNSIDRVTDRTRFRFQMAAAATTGRYWI